QIRYDPKSLSAFTDAHVFKYADKVQLYFTCTVQLCYKHDGGCDGVTPPKCDGVDAAHFEHMDGPPKEHASSEGPPFRIPDFPQEIPFEHLHGNGHPGPEHGPSGKEDLFQGLLNGPGAPEKHFFRPIDIPKEFNRPPYKDSPLNETDIDEISVIIGNFTVGESGRPVLQTAHICVSRTASLLLLFAIIITITLFVVIAVIISRRSPPYHKAMDAFH
ncbi:ZP domain-containing protein, partial [Trichostrongylus colubriformis]